MAPYLSLAVAESWPYEPAMLRVMSIVELDFAPESASWRYLILVKLIIGRWRNFEPFCLVCECRNLSQAVLRLDMSQSVVSLMVQRWRQAIGHPLFVRPRYGVVPTDVAIALRDKLQPLLEGLSLVLANPHGFEPGKSERVFRLHMTDIGQLGSCRLSIAFWHSKRQEIDCESRISPRTRWKPASAPERWMSRSGRCQ
jgi:hypothetical protein